MDLIKDRHIYNIALSFFMCVLIIHLTKYFTCSDIPFSWISTDLGIIFAIIFFRFQKKVKLSILIGLLFYLWSVYALIYHTNDIMTYSITFTYSLTILLVGFRLKISKIITLGVLHFTLISIVYTIKNVEPVKMLLCIMLNIFLSSVHFLIYHKQYFKNIDVYAKYELSSQEQRLIEQLFISDPSNKRIAENLYMSEDNVKKILTGLYDKFEIKKGGSKKTELVAKLGKLHFI